MLSLSLADVLGHAVALLVTWEAGGQGRLPGSGRVAQYSRNSMSGVFYLRRGAQLGALLGSVLSKPFNLRMPKLCSQGKYGLTSF